MVDVIVSEWMGTFLIFVHKVEKEKKVLNTTPR